MQTDQTKPCVVLIYLLYNEKWRNIFVGFCWLPLTTGSGWQVVINYPHRNLDFYATEVIDPTEIWISMLQRSLTLQKFGFLCYRSHWPYRNLDFYATEVIDPYRNLDFYASDLGQKVYKSCGWTQSFSCPATVQGVTPLPSMEESHNMYILHVHCTLYIVHCTLYIVHCTCKMYIVHVAFTVHCIIECNMYHTGFTYGGNCMAQCRSWLYLYNYSRVRSTPVVWPLYPSWTPGG